MGIRDILDTVTGTGEFLSYLTHGITGTGTIGSQEDAEAFMDEYDPEGLIKKADYDIKFHPEGSKHRKAQNMFHSGSGVHLTPMFMGRENTATEHGVISPFVAAEEVEHAKRYVSEASGSASNPYSPIEYMRKSKGVLGDVGEYLSDVIEEGATKATALSNVAKHEGILQALASVPTLLGTYGTYLMPSSAAYDIGKPGDKVHRNEEVFGSGYKPLADLLQEDIDYNKSLGYYTQGVESLSQEYQPWRRSESERGYVQGELDLKRLNRDWAHKIESSEITQEMWDDTLSMLRKDERVQDAGLLDTISNWWNRYDSPYAEEGKLYDLGAAYTLPEDRR
mgnify:CR=1 FL=1